MFNLIFKDFLLQRKITIISIAYSLFLIILALLNIMDNMLPLYTFGIIMTTYCGVTAVVGNEERSKSSIIINSLPIGRDTIVLGKYVSTIFITSFHTAIFVLPYLLLKAIMASNPIPLTDYAILLICLSAILIIFSVYFPLYFKFGYAVMRIFPMIIYCGGLMLPGFLQKLISKNNSIAKNIISIFINNPNKIMIMFFIFSLIILLISLCVSLVIYKNKDL